MFGVVWDDNSSKLKGKQWKEHDKKVTKLSEIKIVA